MRISIDPEHDKIQQEIYLEEEIQTSIAHELNHCCRWHTVGRSNTLLEALVEEGLAVHFAAEITGADPKPWCIAVQGDELEDLKKKAQEEFHREDYDHQAWFFGSEERDIPKWAGYSIAYSFVGNYLEKTGKSAAEMTDRPAKKFIQ